MMVRLILADDHQMFRHALRALLEKDKRMTVVAEASSGDELLDIVRQVQADVVCIDIGMPGMNGIEATRRLLAIQPGIKVIGLSASAVKRRVDRLVSDGVIRSFTIQVDPAVDGLGTEAYVELFCRGTVAPEELKRILSGVPEVVDAGTVTGSADAIVHMRSRDIPSLEVALEKVRIAPNVDHTRSAIVLSRLIHRTHD